MSTLKAEVLIFKLLIFTFLLSCQTFHKESYFFYQGEITIQQKNAKLVHPIEVYPDSQQSQFRVDVFGGFVGVVLSFVWNQEKGITLLIPSEKKYMNSLQSNNASTQQIFSWVIDHLPVFYTSLNHQIPEGWDCQIRKNLQKNSRFPQDQTPKLPKKCQKDKLTILWKYRFLKPHLVQLFLRKKKVTVIVDLKRKNLNYLSPDIFKIQIPDTFEKVNNFDVEFFK